MLFSIPHIKFISLTCDSKQETVKLIRQTDRQTIALHIQKNKIHCIDNTTQAKFRYLQSLASFYDYGEWKFSEKTVVSLLFY